MTTSTPIARNTDPKTSHQAADEILSDLSQTLRRVLAVLIPTKSAMTAKEIGVRCEEVFGGDRETYRKRPHEMVTAGLLQECEVRVCRISGKRAVTFKRRQD